MPEETEHWKRPEFEPTPIETIGVNSLDPNTQKIILTLLRIEKKVEYSMATAEHAYKLARRHDKVLSPIFMVVCYLFGGGGIILLIKLWSLFHSQKV